MPLPYHLKKKIVIQIAAYNTRTRQETDKYGY